MSLPYRERQETAEKVWGTDLGGGQRGGSSLLHPGFETVPYTGWSPSTGWGFMRIGLGSGDHSNRIVTLFSSPYGAPCGAPLDLVVLLT